MWKVVQSHKPPEHPPVWLRAGDAVDVGQRDDEWPAFRLCKCQAGEGWVPEDYIDLTKTPAKMKRDYTTRELDAAPGDVVAVLDRCGGWAFCEVNGIQGWIPERCLAQTP